MHLLETVVAGVVVGLDNLAAALALGALGQRARVARIAAAFTAFGAAAIFVGALLGGGLSGRVAGYADALGALVLGGLGLWTTVAALRGGGPGEGAARRATSSAGLLLLAAGLSVDNLAVGFGLGVRGAAPLGLAAAAGVGVLCCTVLGVLLGNEARVRWERRAQLGAGLLLLALAGVFGARMAG